MARWKVQPAFAGVIHQGCLNCEPVLEIAPLDTLVAVGFGCAMITRGNKVVFMESPDGDDFHYLSEFEEMAKKDPNHDWRLTLEAPLRGRTYQRQGEGNWVLIDSNQGFA